MNQKALKYNSVKLKRPQCNKHMAEMFKQVQVIHQLTTNANKNHDVSVAKKTTRNHKIILNRWVIKEI